MTFPYFFNIQYHIFLFIFKQLVFNTCVAAVKCRPIIHHSVLFSGLQGPWFECGFHFDYGLAYALGGISDVA